jgi:hypothetical protein
VTAKGASPGALWVRERERGEGERREREREEKEVTSPWPSTPPPTVGYVGVCGKVALLRFRGSRAQVVRLSGVLLYDGLRMSLRDPGSLLRANGA